MEDLSEPVKRIMDHAADVLVDACCIKLGSEGDESGGARDMATEIVSEVMQGWRESGAGRDRMSRGDIKDIFQLLIKAAVEVLESIDSRTWDLDVFNQELN